MKDKSKLSINNETKVNFGGKLKKIISIYEFGNTCDSAELRELLSKRKMDDKD